MKIEVFPLGLLQANCYLVFDDRQCVIIDPGASELRYLQPVFDYIDRNDLFPIGILLTHAHFDHVGGVDECVSRYNCPVYLHQSEVTAVTDPKMNLSAPLLRKELRVEAKITPIFDGSVLFANTGLSMKVLHTPGHSLGSCCFFCIDAVFTGDTLFAGSVGRTDFPGGSMETLLQSLDSLRNLCGDKPMLAYPGHGCKAKLPQEFETNYYYKRG